MVNCTYYFKNFDYQSTDKSVSVRIDYKRLKGNSVQNRLWIWNGAHSAAKSLGLDNHSGASFSGRDVKVVTGTPTIGERIPIQVCTAIEEIERQTDEEMKVERMEREREVEEREKNKEDETPKNQSGRPTEEFNNQ